MKQDDIRIVVEIERESFPNYDHVFSCVSLAKWFRHNPEMFFVIAGRNDEALGYAALIPIDGVVLSRLREGLSSSVVEFGESHVPRRSPYMHLEVLAVRPELRGTAVAGRLLLAVADRLLSQAKVVTASPINKTGKKLCAYFGFRQVSQEHIGGHAYSVYELLVNKAALRRKVALLRLIP